MHAPPKKTSTARDYRERINRVLFHIERHLDEPLSLPELAKLACFSPFHFHRIFTAFTGEPLGDLIRRLRLERSALQLIHLDDSITDIALAAGYETPAAYGRAFQALFGLAPSAYREQGKSWPDPGSLLLALDPCTGEDELAARPELRTIDALPVLFVRRTGPYGQAAREAFEVLCRFASTHGLMGPSTRPIGISHDDPTVTSSARFRYDACLTLDREVRAEGEIGQKNLAGGRYAVFLHAGPYERLGPTFDQIYKGWLPGSREQLRDEPCFQAYLNSPGQVEPEALRTEIWIPVL